jgi:hypothetical protein
VAYNCWYLHGPRAKVVRGGCTARKAPVQFLLQRARSAGRLKLSGGIVGFDRKSFGRVDGSATGSLNFFSANFARATRPRAFVSSGTMDD